MRDLKPPAFASKADTHPFSPDRNSVVAGPSALGSVTPVHRASHLRLVPSKTRDVPAEADQSLPKPVTRDLTRFPIGAQKQKFVVIDFAEQPDQSLPPDKIRLIRPKAAEIPISANLEIRSDDVALAA